MITSLLRQSDVAVWFWRNNDLIIASSVRLAYIQGENDIWEVLNHLNSVTEARKGLCYQLPSLEMSKAVTQHWSYWLPGRPTKREGARQDDVSGSDFSHENRPCATRPHGWLIASSLYTCICPRGIIVASHARHGISNHGISAVQQLVQTNNKEIIKCLQYWLFVRGIHPWLIDSPHKGPGLAKTVSMW